MAAHLGKPAAVAALSRTTRTAVAVRPETQCAAGCGLWSRRREFAQGLCFGWKGPPLEGTRVKGPGCLEVLAPCVCLAAFFQELDGPHRRDADEVLQAARRLVRMCGTFLSSVQTSFWWRDMRHAPPPPPHFDATWRKGSTDLERGCAWQCSGSGRDARRAVRLLPQLALRQAALHPREARAVYGADLRADRDVVLRAVARDGVALRATVDVALAAIKEDARAFEYASASLTSDRGFMLAAAARNGDVLEHCAFRTRRNVVL